MRRWSSAKRSSAQERTNRSHSSGEAAGARTSVFRAGRPFSGFDATVVISSCPTQCDASCSTLVVRSFSACSSTCSEPFKSTIIAAFPLSGLQCSVDAGARAMPRLSAVFARVCGAGRRKPIARLAMSNDRRVSSGRLWRTFHVQSPSRLGKARLYLASRQPVEPPIPASTHLLRKSGQKQGFIARMKAEPNDKIAGDCRHLISRRVKECQSHPRPPTPTPRCAR